MVVQVQSSGLSLLDPTVTVYAADQTTVLGSASGTGYLGSTISVTINGVSAESVYATSPSYSLPAYRVRQGSGGS